MIDNTLFIKVSGVGMVDVAMPDLITQKEAANMIRMSEAWFERQRWAKKGIPYFKLGGRIFYDKKDLLTWLDDQRTSK